MKVAILVEDYFDERELLYPYYRFREAGAEVRLLAPRAGEYHGKFGFPIRVEEPVRPEDAEEYDLVFIPGGYAPDRLRRHSTVLEFVKRMHAAGKWVVSVCHGPWVLISAGVVRGRRVTGVSAIKDDLINAGADYTGNSYEIDGNLATATGPDSLAELFAQLMPRLAHM